MLLNRAYGVHVPRLHGHLPVYERICLYIIALRLAANFIGCADMAGFPILVGVVLWRINRAGTHAQADNVEAFGWIYGACEADVFYYGWLSILRRTLFVIIARLPDTLAQSTISVILVAGLWLFHVKLEPYKDYFLDLLDMVLLGCLFTVAVGSLTFNRTSTPTAPGCFAGNTHCIARRYAACLRSF